MSLRIRITVHHRQAEGIWMHDFLCATYFKIKASAITDYLRAFLGAVASSILLVLFMIICTVNTIKVMNGIAVDQFNNK